MQDHMQEFCMAEGITFRYFEQSKRNILEKVSLSFKKGEVTVILGNSGCGKSTFASVLCGLYPENGGFLESGAIRIDGRDLAELKYGERSRYIVQMFQNPDLQFCMDNLREELRFCLENRCVPREDMDRQIEEFASRYKTFHLLDRPFFQMSGGEKQKAALCCLLLLDPRVMVLDEPFANLDEDSRLSYMELLTKKAREEHTTIIAIDHRAENWLRLADRFVVMGEKGEIKQERIPAEELYQWREYLIEQGLNDPFPESEGEDRGENPGENHREKPGENLGKKPSKKRPDETHREVLGTDRQDFPHLLTLTEVSIFHERKKEGKPVLSNVTLTADQGQMIACLGPSGGGKTSLFLTLLGQKPYTGFIGLLTEHGGVRELGCMKERELFSRVGIVFQNPGSQFITMSVLDEVKESLRIWKKVPEETADQEARGLLARYQLDHYSKYSPYMLSQGQQRRLGVLVMLAGGQTLLLLDEPTYGQDGRTTRAIMEQMKERVKDGLTVLFSTHDRQVARRYADKIWHIEQGSGWEEEVTG